MRKKLGLICLFYSSCLHFDEKMTKYDITLCEILIMNAAFAHVLDLVTWGEGSPLQANGH